MFRALLCSKHVYYKTRICALSRSIAKIMTMKKMMMMMTMTMMMMMIIIIIIIITPIHLYQPFKGLWLSYVPPGSVLKYSTFCKQSEFSQHTSLHWFLDVLYQLKKCLMWGATTSVRPSPRSSDRTVLHEHFDESTTLSRNVGHASPSTATPCARRRETSTEPSDFHEIRYKNSLQVFEQATVAFYLRA